jgi:predicted HicB family RNase H-like nuclease
MTDILTYNGHSARIEFDAEDDVFFGQIAGIEDGVTFHADDVADLRSAFREAVDDYLATCGKLGKTPEKAYSGKLMLRVDPRLHAQLVRSAKLAGKSLNQFGEEILGRGLAGA